jgi:cell division protein FtsB
VRLSFALPLLLAFMLAWFQVDLWYGQKSMLAVWSLHSHILKERTHTKDMILRNRELVATIDSLKSGNEAIESLARSELGLIKQNEMYYLVVNGAAYENSSHE